MGSTLIMKYGYVTKIENTPTDNVWTEGREITINDSSIVYGYEGKAEANEQQGLFIIGDAQQFREWLTLNTPPHGNP